MENLVRTRWGCNGEKIIVVPCRANTVTAAKAREKYEEVRRRPGLTDRLVATDCGSLEHWQARMPA